MRFRVPLLFLWLVAAAMCLVPNRVARAAEPFKVTFMCPTGSAGHPFWGNYVGFMEAAASDLGIELTVNYGGDRFEHLDNLRSLLELEEKPDCLLIVYHRGTGRSMLELTAGHGVPVYMVNTAIPDDDARAIGKPRERFPQWIGQMYPDDREGGRLLADALIRAARERAGDAVKVEMAAISGSRISPAALERNKGLADALAEHPGVMLDRLVFGRWKYDTAYEKTRLLVQKNKRLHAIWTASDTMGLGVLDGVASLPGEGHGPIVTGGFDWSKGGMDAVEDGQFVATVGGHFMEGAWALVLVHDHLRGVDFADTGLVHRLKMLMLRADNVGLGRKLVEPARWESLDFRYFSRFHNPSADYDFGLQSIEKACEKGDVKLER